MAWRDEMFHNPGLKLFSIGLACLVWFAVHERNASPAPVASSGPVVAKDYVRLPITVLQPAGESRAFRIQPGFVSVRVSGDQSLLQELRGSDLEVFVNLSDAGDRLSTTRRVRVLAPAGVTVRTIEPGLVRAERVQSSE